MKSIWNGSKSWNIFWIRLFRNRREQAEFVTTIMDLFDIYNEDGDGNCLFGAVSRLIYGTPDHHK